MHETVIANEIIKKAQQQGKVKSIVVEVGELANIPAHHLKEALASMTDWHIRMIKKKATVRCTCGFKGAPRIIEKSHDATFFECPKCRQIPNVIDGKDIILKEVEVF
jgi:Zn finger protein HypA/HybF involved in hydrogenase expression